MAEKKALMLASVASMIDQFCMPNIELLQSLGYKVDVVADFKNPGSITDERVKELKQRLIIMNADIINISIPRNIDFLAIILAYREVRDILDSEYYDLIHCQSPIGGAIARIAAKNTKKNGTKIIYTAHGFHFYTGSPIKNWIVFYTVEKYLSRYTDVLITINKEDFNRAKRKFNAKMIVYLPGIGIDILKFSQNKIDINMKRATLGISTENIMIISVGELNDNKNHITIIKALARFSNNNIHYVVVGQGILKEYLQNEARKRGVNIHLLGYRTDVAELYASADIFVLPSKREGLNVSLMEAMASGLPCVVSRIRGNVDLIDNPAFLASSKDEGSFCKAIENIFKMPKESIKNHNFRKIQNFSKDRIMERMKKIYIDNSNSDR